MDPEKFEEDSPANAVDESSNPTPPQGIPRVGAVLGPPPEGEPEVPQPPVAHEPSGGTQQPEPDQPVPPTPSTGVSEEDTVITPVSEPVADEDDDVDPDDLVVTVEEGYEEKDDESPERGHVFDSEYRPHRPPPKKQKEFPFWAWLAIPVALVLGIILVLVFRPVSDGQPQPPAPSESGAAAPSNPNGSERVANSNEIPLPLATPAPPGKFRAVGLAIFSGPDDVQINPGSVVLPDTRLTFRLSYHGAQLKDKVEVRWELNDQEWTTETVHLNPWTTSQWFTHERPDSGWPEGRYRLTVFHDEKEESSIFFEVNATGQPAPDTATVNESGEIQGGSGVQVEGSTTESEFSFSSEGVSPSMQAVSPSSEGTSN